MITVLHVDDDADIREIADLSLALTGEFTLVQADSGAAALDRARDLTPDILLLDMMMPGMTGQETLQALRDMPHLGAVPAVFMTARAQVEDLGDMSGLGVVDVICKPFDPLELPGQIKAVLEAL